MTVDREMDQFERDMLESIRQMKAGQVRQRDTEAAPWLRSVRAQKRRRKGRREEGSAAVAAR